MVESGSDAERQADRGPAPKTGPLFDPSRQEALQAKGRRIGLIAALLLGAVFAAVFWSLEQLWWLSAGVFFAVVLVAVATTWAVTHKPVPTVCCHSCGGRGWIDDLMASNGACPACGADRFFYYRYRGRHGPLARDDIAGSELLERRREDGLPWI